VQNLMSKGMGAAEGMKEQEGSVKGEVVEGIKTEVRNSVIQTAVTKLISMFVPGGGLIQLFITAFDMVRFFMSEGQRIFSLISSVMGSIGAIASGNISAAVAGVETSLAKSIPVALSFLSKIFKVGGIGTKVKNIIQKVKGRIDKVVSRVMDKAAALVAKVVGKGTDLASSAKDKGKALLSKLKDGIFGKKNFQAGKEQHSVWVKVANGEPELWIASTPREAGKQLAELRAEATQKGVFTVIEPSWKVAQSAISDARGKLRTLKNDPNLTDEKKKSREADTKKRMTDIVNGVQHSVKDVFDQLEKNGGNSSNLQVHLDAKILRAEIWAGGRPGWAKKTLDALIRDYPWAFDSNGNILKDSFNKPMYDRRHIVAFDKIIDTEVAQINGKTMTQAATYLTGRGNKHTPKKNSTNGTVDITSIKTSLKSLLAIEFNEVTNLWVGDAAHNQLIGREFAAAQQRRKAMTPGTPEYEAESAKIATNQIDVPGGSGAGRQLNATELEAISEINDSALLMQTVEANRSILNQMFLGKIPRTSLFTRIRTVQDDLRKAIKTLGKCTRLDMSGKTSTSGLTISDTQKAKLALDLATKHETRLNEIFRKE
jgi:hypothetical protein